MLRLLAAQALLALGRGPEAEAALSAMAAHVSEGLATFNELAGIEPLSVTQQAMRLLAQVGVWLLLTRTMGRCRQR